MERALVAHVLSYAVLVSRLPSPLLHDSEFLQHGSIKINLLAMRCVKSKNDNISEFVRHRAAVAGFCCGEQLVRFLHEVMRATRSPRPGEGLVSPRANAFTQGFPTGEA